MRTEIKHIRVAKINPPTELFTRMGPVSRIEEYKTDALQFVMADGSLKSMYYPDFDKLVEHARSKSEVEIVNEDVEFKFEN